MTRRVLLANDEDGGTGEIEGRPKMVDLGLRERAVMLPIIVAIVFLGVYPKPVLDRINPTVNQLVAHVQQAAAAGPVGPASVEGGS